MCCNIFIRGRCWRVYNVIKSVEAVKVTHCGG